LKYNEIIISLLERRSNLAKRTGMKNEYKIMDDYVILYCKYKKEKVFEVKIDKHNLQKLIDFGYTWTIFHSWTTGFYVRTTYYCGTFEGKPKYKMLYLHRYLTDAKENEYVDHRDQDGLNNLESNFRITTNANNLKHRKGANKNNKTGYRNISYIKKEDIYRVQFQVDGKNTRFGDFKKLEDAVKFADIKRKELYGDYSGKSEIKNKTK